MVQNIYNTYRPQFYTYPPPLRPPVAGDYFPPYLMPVQQDVFQPAPQFVPMPQPFIPCLPPCIYPPNYMPQSYLPTNIIADQQIFNQPFYNQAFYTSQTPVNQQPIQPQPAQQQGVTHDVCPWVTDPELKLAMTKLAEINHLPEDIAYLTGLGVNPPFKNGKEALDIISKNQVKVEFGDMGDSPAHAQYVNDENKIVINQKYQGKMTLPMALAIADAMYHEAGHAKDKDDKSSIQEELDCLALNTLGYRYQQKAYPEITNANNQSRLLSDGVALYPKLFFDADPQKTALVKRVTEKYGFLPITSPNHDSPNKQLSGQIKQMYNAVSQNNPQA